MTELDTADGIMASREMRDLIPEYFLRLPEAIPVRDAIAALRSAHEAGKREGIEAAAEIARERVALWEPWSEERTQEAKHLADAILSLSTSPTGGWRDIKDAPKDGTHVIVTDGLGVYGSAWFHPEERVWLDCDGCVPTQFQPLPAPPADGGR